MSVHLVRVVISLPLALFVPGFLFVLTFFEDLKMQEKIAFGIALSIFFDISIGIFFGFNESVKEKYGGLTPENVWTATIMITFIFMILFLLKKGYEIWRQKKE